MKRFFAALGAVLLALTVSVSALAEETRFDYSQSDYDYTRFAGQGMSINVYNWGEYISDGGDGALDTNREFEALTGIKVNYTTFATNEELYAKLKSGGSDYDIIIPSDYMVSKMIGEDMLEPLNYDNIPNFQYIDEAYRNLEYDPENRYTVPYTWGTVGIIYNTTMVDGEIDSWDALWDEQYKGNMLMFGNSRDAFAIAQSRLGIPYNSTEKDDYRKAADELIKQKPLVQAYVMDQIYDKMEGGEAALAPYYAGDAIVMMEENEDLAFVVPKEGANLFVDAICIPKGCQKKEAAEMYINFLSEPQVAAANIEYIGYSTPSSAAFALLDEETQNNPVIYPPEETLAKCQAFRSLPEDVNLYMDSLWTEIMSAGTGKNNLVGILVGCGVAVVVIVLIVLAAIRKKKRESMY